MDKFETAYKTIKSCDVLIAGGGSAGVAAAISAARSGASVILIEKNTFLGGMATGALVTPMMKNSVSQKENISPMLLNKGLFIEICERLSKINGGATFKDGNPGWFNPEIYKILLEEMCIEAGVEIIYDSQIIHAEVISKEIQKIVFLNKGSFYGIGASEFIDCTGDGDLISLSDVSFEEGIDNKRQALSLRFMMAGVDLNEFGTWLEGNDSSGNSPVYRLDNGDILLSTAFTHESAWALKPFFDEAIKNNDLSKEDSNYFQVFSIPNAKGLLAFNCPRLISEKCSYNPLDFSDSTKVLIKGRKMIKAISQFCRKYLPGFKDSYICQIAPNIGVRETRRLIGQYVLTADDVLSAKKFDDAVASSNWPIDIHPSKIGEKGQLRHPPVGEYYQIPLRSLLPKKDECKNLIVAGRNLSATFEAQGSARIQPCCIAMGEAAGKLAASRIKSS